MDRKIEQKGGIRKKHIPYIAGGIFVILVSAWLLLGDHRSSLRVDTRTLTIAEAKQGEFNDYVRVNGSVLPITTIQLSTLENGMVEERVVEEGAFVEKGDVIIRLTNPQLTMQILDGEANLAEKENQLRNTIVSMEQEKLNIRREKLRIVLDVTRKKRNFEQNENLYNDKLISLEEYLQAKEDYEIAVEEGALISERQIQDSIYRSQQIDNMEISLESMQRNMQLIRQRVDNLNIRSAINGELGMLDIVLGQYISSGSKVGQINDLSNFKIEAMIDEHYIDKVNRGLVGSFERGGESFDISVSTVFPEVRGGQFRTWLRFSGERPENIRAGQTYYINLQLGSPTNGIIIPRGAFYQTTGGNWIFVVEGDKAVRRAVRIGRQNPQYYEVLEGLKDGEKVVVSSYETYGENETLTLN